MKILSIQALRGPNIWSVNRKKLIQMRLDLEEMEQAPTNKIPGFRLNTVVRKRCVAVFFNVLKEERGWDT
jgi:hypothetical protein